MQLERLKAQLKYDEGVMLTPYIDTVGKTTIGVGRNLTDRGISLDEATYLLIHDINSAIGVAAKFYPDYLSLDDVRQEVLVNMAFNMGDSLMQFVGLLAAIKAKDWQAAHDHMLSSKWANQVHARATRLAQAMLTGSF